MLNCGMALFTLEKKIKQKMSVEMKSRNKSVVKSNECRPISRWLEALHALKVSYITASNKVIVPEVFLQSPLFHVGYPNSVNMGGLGVRMAEAILEGVLGRGLLFDSTGRLVSSSNNSPRKRTYTKIGLFL